MCSVFCQAVFRSSTKYFFVPHASNLGQAQQCRWKGTGTRNPRAPNSHISPARIPLPLLAAAADHSPRRSGPTDGDEDAIHRAWRRTSLQNGDVVYDAEILLRHRDLPPLSL
jgi:hypothetical protein